MTLTSSGNLGVGTTTPLAQLEVDTSAATVIGEIIKGSASQSADLFQVQDSTSAILTKIDSTGMLTLKAAPTSSLQAATKGYVDTAVTGLGDFKADGSVPMTGSLKMGGNTINGNSTASGNLTLDSTSNATKGFVNIAPSGGNVGIGTTSPAVAFEVNGLSQFDNQLGVEYLGSNTSEFNGLWVMQKNNAASGAILQLDHQYNGFGSLSNNDSIGEIWFSGADSTNTHIKPMSRIKSQITNVTHGAVQSQLIFSTRKNSTLADQMLIDPSGNVGINTTSPGAKLEIDWHEWNNTQDRRRQSSRRKSPDFGCQRCRVLGHGYWRRWNRRFQSRRHSADDGFTPDGWQYPRRQQHLRRKPDS